MKSLYIQKVILNIADATSKNLIIEKSTYAAAIQYIIKTVCIKL